MSQHTYRVAIDAQLFFTIEADQALSPEEIQSRTEELIHDDGFDVPGLPEGVVYHPGEITAEVMDHREP